ncbi:DUF6880 family protein [uncultured Methylobacterium sp.]|uniref:DUF6880 family protein n=1 Tax=uncultured Methylobacterium sp. TaxID=157278 RepID=UPI0035CBE933
MARKPAASAPSPRRTTSSGAAKPLKGARRTTPSPETLAALGPDRLIGLILGETARNPAFRKLVSAALAALQGPDAVAAIVDRRLAALEGARGYIDWQKRRAFTTDLDATVTVILSELGPLDPPAALDRLLRFLDGADAVLNRVDDGTGAMQGVYERASDAAVEIAAGLDAVQAGRFALALLPRVAADPYGPFGRLIRDLVPRLPAEALAPLDAGLAEAAEALAPTEAPRAGKGGEAVAFRRDLHRVHLLRVRQDIADRRGDVDGYVALERAIMPERPDPLEIARRLLDADRVGEALDWVRRPQPSRLRVVTREMLTAGDFDAAAPERERLHLEIRILDALGRGADAQALRWTGFEAMRDAGMLRDHLAKLPDFEDEEALERALDHVGRDADPHRALAFLVDWPSLDRAARLVCDHRDAWRGEHYRLLGRAAEALGEDHPLAATLLYRRLIDDILGQGRSTAYPHAARYLLELDGLAGRLGPAALDPDPNSYRAALRRAHGRKHGFWSLLKA